MDCTKEITEGVPELEWWKQCKAKGISGFLNLKYKGPPPPAGKPGLAERFETQGFATTDETVAWTLETYQMEYTANGLGSHFRKHGIELKTGSPHHLYGKERGKRAAFKKSDRN